jgi:hypothetical protein
MSGVLFGGVSMMLRDQWQVNLDEAKALSRPIFQVSFISTGLFAEQPD